MEQNTCKNKPTHVLQPQFAGQPNLWHLVKNKLIILQGKHCPLLQTNKLSVLRHSFMPRFFPVVYADEQSKSADNSKAVTSMDKLLHQQPTIIVTDSEVQDFLKNETGKQRFYKLFEKTEDGSFCPDLEFVFTTAKTTSMVTFAIGTVLGARAARPKVVRKQQIMKFDHTINAVRRHNDALLIGALKTGMSFAIKMGLFIGIFTLTTQSISVYRNKSSVVEYISAGVITGALSRFFLGPKGMVGGAFVGGGLGLIGGAMILLILKSTNETVEQRHYWYIHEQLKQSKVLQQMSSREST